jgi:hypothetical protein
MYTVYVYYNDDTRTLPWEDASSAATDGTTGTASSTPEAESVSTPVSGTSGDTSEVRPPVTTTPTPKPSAVNVQAEAERISEALDALAKDIEANRINEPRSPYAGTVTLANGNASAQSAETEYLTLTAASSNGTAVDITGWKLESYVTASEASIPEGTRTLMSEGDRTKTSITLRPGEVAYVVTGETPLRVSFRENECTGYLSGEGSFGPSLTRSCPLPSDELLQYGNVKSSDSRCYDYVRGIGQCEARSDESVEAAELTGACEMFILNVLTYEGCVEKHSTDGTFYAGGTWRIFLNRSGELWRSTKDVVRLIDKEGRVVSVLEY